MRFLLYFPAIMVVLPEFTHSTETCEECTINWDDWLIFGQEEREEHKGKRETEEAPAQNTETET